MRRLIKVKRSGEIEREGITWGVGMETNEKDREEIERNSREFLFSFLFNENSFINNLRVEWKA